MRKMWGIEWVTTMMVATMMIGLFAVNARAQYYDHYDHCDHWGLQWELERQTRALEGIAWSLEQYRLDRWAEERARVQVEMAQIWAERDAQDRQDFDRRFNTVQNEASALVVRYHRTKAKDAKESREERIERLWKWKQYRQMSRYGTARWGY